MSRVRWLADPAPASGRVRWLGDPAPVGVGVELPSGHSATDLVEGKPGALGRVLVHMIGRAALIGIGLSIAGARHRRLFKYALAGSAAIEAFVLAYAAAEKKRQEKA